MVEDWIREDYFLKFDINRTTLLPLRDVDQHLPLYKKKGDTTVEAPRLFTLAILQKHGIQDQYEEYEPKKDQI